MKLSSKDKFLALGLDSDLATKLVSLAIAPGKLLKMPSAKLLGLGLDKGAQAKLKRPPIPPERLFNLLRKCKRICCVCRTPNLNIIVHHIKEWHASRSHAEKNLVVLCMNDHGEAHTERKLGQNHTPESIRKHKETWEAEVRSADARAVVGLSQSEGANWDYINHTRLFRFAAQLGIDCRNMNVFARLHTLDVVSEDGYIRDLKVWAVSSKPSFYLYDMGESRLLYSYTSAVLERVVEKLGTVDISAVSCEELRIAAKNGALVFVQAPFISATKLTLSEERTNYEEDIQKSLGSRFSSVSMPGNAPAVRRKWIA
jgi:hypothetical protein